MINNDKWISSLPNKNSKNYEESATIDHKKWIDTIPKDTIPKNTIPRDTIPRKETYNSFKKYSLMTVVFVCGLIIVSVVKNQTRNLEKEINYLESSIDLIEFNLKQAILDNEVITSPENLSKLAKEYLNEDFVYYKKSQIRNLNNGNEIYKKKKEKIKTKTLNNLSVDIKNKISKKIKTKKEEIEKLQELYENPKKIPVEIRKKVSKQIEEKKFELKNLYQSPGEVITLERIGRWSIVQVFKAFLGIPILPGR